MLKRKFEKVKLLFCVQYLNTLKFLKFENLQALANHDSLLIFFDPRYVYNI